METQLKSKTSNTLTSHVPESANSRADKMSGLGRRFLRLWYRGKSKRHFKKFYGKKRRHYLKNPKYF